MPVSSRRQGQWTASAHCDAPNCSWVSPWVEGDLKTQVEDEALYLLRAHSTAQHPPADKV
jgi:hypothetical protein